MEIQEVTVLTDILLSKINKIRERISHQEYSALTKGKAELKEIEINAKSFLFIAFEGEEVIGYCTLGENTLELSETNKNSSLEIMFFIDPDYQGNRNGEKLARHAIGKAKEIGGINTLSGWVKKENARSIQLLTRLCFKLASNHKAYDVYNLQIT